jgi:hypothetical protein
MLKTSSFVRRLALVLVLCLFASIVIIAFHHHYEDGAHDDCPVCNVVHHMSSTVFSAFSFGIFLVMTASSLAEKAVSLSSSLVSILFSRAPPA